MTSGAEQSHLAKGRRLGRYEICAELASGGMATVYLARATGPAGFDKLVALKVVHPRLARERGFIDMFLDEARIASRITHANVGSVFDVGEEDGTYYLAMDYLHGESLASVLGCVARMPDARVSPLYPIHVMAIMAAACEGLHAAHELRGDTGSSLEVVHRDVSPHNIFVTYDGGVRVVDFGIARAAGRLHKTLSGTIKGKVAYMPPEQLRGDPLDRRADIWAIGVTLWELLTCRRLFRRESQGKTIDAVLTAFIPAPSTFAPHLPAGIDDLVASTLSRDPDGRPATARELGRSLRRAIAQSGEIAGMAELAEWMETLFAEHREAKRRMIEEARRGGVVKSVPDTQRFARIPADLVPTVGGEQSDVFAKARPGMDTLKDGGMGVVRAGLGTGAETETETETETGAETETETAAETETGAKTETGAETETGTGSASVHSRPVFQTESVVLPTHAKSRALFFVALGALALVTIGALSFAFFTTPEDTSMEPAVAPPSPETLARPEAVETTAAPEPPVVAEDPPLAATTADPPEAPPTKRLETTKRPPAERPATMDAPAVTPAGPGRLSLGVRGGWGTFVVDGVHRGDTPHELTLPAGRHRVVIRPFGEGEPIRRTVTVRPGETARVTVDAP